MILSNKIFKSIFFILACILLLLPVTLALMSLYFNISPHYYELKPIETFSNYIYVLRNFGFEALFNQLIQKKDIQIIVFISFLFSIFFVTFCVKSREKTKELTYISDSKLYKDEAAIRHAKSMHKKDLNDNKSTTSGIQIHPKIKITELREQNNFLILGTTGAGKSTAFKPLVKQAIERGDYALIYDEKGEYTQSFFNKNTTILLAPWDARSASWDISSDIQNKQDAELLAQCLIPDSNSKDPLWDSGARIILVSMIMMLINTKRQAWGWEDIYKQLTTPLDLARSILVQHHPIVEPLLTPNSKTTTSFYAHMMSKLSWIETLATAWSKQNNKTFSLKEWVTENTKKRIVIVQADSQFKNLGEPLCNAIISFMTKHFLGLSNSSYRKTWLFVDEFANLPRNPNISAWLELGRSNGARSVLCTQSISQLHSIYSEDEANTILNLLSNVIAFRVGAVGSDAKNTASIFGKYEAEVPNYDHPDRIGTRSNEPLVKPSELIQLGQPTKHGVEGFMQIPSWNAVYKLRWPLFKDSGNAVKKVPAKWLTKSTSKPNIQPKVKQPANRLNKRKINNDVN